MLDSINHSLRNFTNFKGRASRREYLYFLLFYIVIDFFVNFANPNMPSLNAVIMLVLIVPLLAVEVRRSHDVGRSGWWVLVPFYSLYLMFAKSVDDSTEKPGDRNSL